MNVNELEKYGNTLLSVAAIKDYCPNGLQVEASDQVQVICTAVTASLEAIDMARVHHADVLLVHHGYFWQSEAQPLVGLKGRRIQRLFQSEISLLAYHLPLDVHLSLGNNAQLGEQLGINDCKPSAADERGLLWEGSLDCDMAADAFASRIERVLSRKPLVVGSSDKPLRHIAWCTGAAQNAIEQAAAVGADAFISGEISEQTTHLAREYGLTYFAAGHHATERYGVQALGRHLAQQFGLQHIYLELDNPV